MVQQNKGQPNNNNNQRRKQTSIGAINTRVLGMSAIGHHNHQQSALNSSSSSNGACCSLTLATRMREWAWIWAANRLSPVCVCVAGCSSASFPLKPPGQPVGLLASSSLSHLSHLDFSLLVIVCSAHSQRQLWIFACAHKEHNPIATPTTTQRAVKLRCQTLKAAVSSSQRSISLLSFLVVCVSCSEPTMRAALFKLANDLNRWTFLLPFFCGAAAAH